jgi:hypothetical protein
VKGAAGKLDRVVVGEDAPAAGAAIGAAGRARRPTTKEV